MQIRIGLLVLAWFAMGLTNSAWAQALNPADYTSLGSSFTGGVIDTNSGTINGSIQGIFVNNIAVFTFDQIVIGSGSSVTASGTRPFALLSKSNISVMGTGVIALQGQTGLTLSAGGSAVQAVAMEEIIIKTVLGPVMVGPRLTLVVVAGVVLEAPAGQVRILPWVV